MTPEQIHTEIPSFKPAESMTETDQLRQELEAVRQSGTVEEIGQIEWQTVASINMIINWLPAHSPNLNLWRQEIYESLLQELNIRYLMIDQHPLVLTTDNNAIFVDSISTGVSSGIVTDKINGKKDNGDPITITDIIAFSTQTKSERFKFKLDWRNVTATKPEKIQAVKLFNSIKNELNKKGDSEGAAEILRKMISFDPENPKLYYDLRTIINRDKDTIGAYSRYSESIQLLSKFIELANKDKSRDWTKAIEEAETALPHYKEKLDSLMERTACWGASIAFRKESDRKTNDIPTTEK